MKEYYTSLFKGNVHVTTVFSSSHNGIDLGNYKTNNKIYSPNALGTGEVSKILIGDTVKSTYYPNVVTVFIKYPNNLESYMTHGHKNNIQVELGQVINVGDLVYITGNEGYSFGDHLHYTLKNNGVAIDPAPYILDDLNSKPSEMFKVGDKIEITTSQNIRKGSGNSYDVTGKTNVGDLWTIKDGPRTADGYTWFDAQQDGGGTGWLADGGWFKLYEKEPEIIDPCQDTKDELASVRKELAASQALVKEVVQENDKLHDEIERLELEYAKLEGEIDMQTPAIEEETDVLLAIVVKRVQDEKSKL